MTEKKTVQTDLSDELDAVLLKVVRSGRPLLDKEGRAVLDDEDKPVLTLPSAQDLNVARQRLKDLGLTHVVSEGDVADELAREIGIRDGKVFKFPQLSTEPDGASTEDRREGIA